MDYQPTKGGVAREDVAAKNEQYGKGKGRVDGARQMEYSTSASTLVPPSHLGLGLGLGLLCLLLILLLTLGIRLHLNLLLLSSTTISSISRRGVGDRTIEQGRASANHSNGRSGLLLLRVVIGLQIILVLTEIFLAAAASKRERRRLIRAVVTAYLGSPIVRTFVGIEGVGRGLHLPAPPLVLCLFGLAQPQTSDPLPLAVVQPELVVPTRYREGRRGVGVGYHRCRLGQDTGEGILRQKRGWWRLRLFLRLFKIRLLPFLVRIIAHAFDEILDFVIVLDKAIRPVIPKLLR